MSKNRKNILLPLLQFISFWGLSIFLFAKAFQLGEELATIDWYFSLLFHISLIATVTINVRLLIPRHLQKRNFVAYAFTFLASIGFGIFLNQLTFDFIADWIFPEYYFISYLEFWEIGLYVLAYVILASLLKLSLDWFRSENQRLQAEKKEKERLDEELRALKAQINPHFLFNNLNLLYGMSVRKADELPDLIIQLSDLLRYVMYQTNSPKVSLSSEIKMIEDYISLSKKRMHEDSEISWTYEAENEELPIPPLLFLPLVENGFKYGIFAQTKGAQLKMKMVHSGDFITFETSNPLAPETGRRKEGGVGLSNLRRRLTRLFPNGHELIISEHDENFTVKMKIDITQCVV